MHSNSTIVFLHGNGANGTMWKTHMDQLSEFHCLAPDFPGFGQSNDLQWESIAETAEQVTGIIRNRARDGRAHIVGLSLGGSVAMVVLSKAPEIVDHAIVDGSGVLPLPGLALMKIGFRILQPLLHTSFVIATIARSTGIKDNDYQEFRKGMLAMSPSAFTRSFTEAIAMKQPPGLEKAVCPVLFVAGEREPEAVKRSQAMLANAMPNALARLAPGRGHGWLAEAVDTHVKMVRAWLTDQRLPRELEPNTTKTD